MTPLLSQKIDRLRRSSKQIINTIDELSTKGVKFKSLDGRIDTACSDESMNLLIIALLGSLAQIERELILSRTKEGKELSGNFGGSKPKPDLNQRNEIRLKIKDGITKPVLQREYDVSKSTIIRIQNSQK